MFFKCLNCSEELEETYQYCSSCGAAADKEEVLIRYYFQRGFDYSVILLFLEKYHATEMSMRTLHNRLREYGLRRRNANSDDAEIYQAIQQELDGPGCMRGYRAMWHTLRLDYGIQAPRRKVEGILQQVDPEETALRKAHALRRRSYTNPGPNFAWHVDGYDKLKPYGFPIHGAVDGFSRRVMWLKICLSNNDPCHVASLFYNCVKSNRGCPRVLRTDCGTENVTMAAMQCYFRGNGNDDQAGLNAHRYGSSPTNQRIEGWWSFYRHERSTWWINFFKDLVETNIVDNASELSMSCLWFCFKDILQADLDHVRDHWNTHYIQKSRHDTVPGRPDELFYLPENSGFEDFRCPITEQQLDDMAVYCTTDEEENIFLEYFNYALESLSLNRPTNWREALTLFQRLMQVSQ